MKWMCHELSAAREPLQKPFIFSKRSLFCGNLKTAWNFRNVLFEGLHTLWTRFRKNIAQRLRIFLKIGKKGMPWNLLIALSLISTDSLSKEKLKIPNACHLVHYSGIKCIHQFRITYFSWNNLKKLLDYQRN